MAYWDFINIGREIKSEKNLGKFTFQIKHRYQDIFTIEHFNVPVWHYILQNGLHILVPKNVHSIWYPPSRNIRNLQPEMSLATDNLAHGYLNEDQSVALLHLKYGTNKQGKIILSSGYEYQTNDFPVRLELSSSSLFKTLFDEVHDINWQSVQNFGKVNIRLLGKNEQPLSALFYDILTNAGQRISISYDAVVYQYEGLDKHIISGDVFFLHWNSVDNIGQKSDVSREILEILGITQQLPPKIDKPRLDTLVNSVINDITNNTMKKPFDYLNELVNNQN